MNAIDLVLMLVGLAGSAAQKLAGAKAGQVISIVDEIAALGRAAYDYVLAETGQPIDFSKIPEEAPIAEASSSSPGAAAAAAKPALEIVAPANPAMGPSSYADLQAAVEGSAPAAAPVLDPNSRCPFCGAAGVQLGQTCPACGKVHQ